MVSKSIFILRIVFGTASNFSKKVLVLLVPLQALARFVLPKPEEVPKKTKNFLPKPEEVPKTPKKPKIFLSSGLGASKT